MILWQNLDDWGTVKLRALTGLPHHGIYRLLMKGKLNVLWPFGEKSIAWLVTFVITRDFTVYEIIEKTTCFTFPGPVWAI